MTYVDGSLFPNEKLSRDLLMNVERLVSHSPVKVHFTKDCKSIEVTSMEVERSIVVKRLFQETSSKYEKVFYLADPQDKTHIFLQNWLMKDDDEAPCLFSCYLEK